MVLGPFLMAWEWNKEKRKREFINSDVERRISEIGYRK
jgi:hypothetical protein